MEITIVEDQDIMERPTTHASSVNDSDSSDYHELTIDVHQFSIPMKVVGSKADGGAPEREAYLGGAFMDDQPTSVTVMMDD